MESKVFWLPDSLLFSLLKYLPFKNIQNNVLESELNLHFRQWWNYT